MLIRLRGRSMTPAFGPGDLVWFRAAASVHPRRGQIVLVRRAGESFVKRLIGLPGERVEIEGIHVSIDGKPLKEPYVDPSAALEPKAGAAWSLGPNQWIVLGDARDDSRDSRRFGPVDRSELAAIAVCRLWPAPRWAVASLRLTDGTSQSPLAGPSK